MPKSTFKFAAAVVCLSIMASARGGTLGDTPTSFFTNMAERLLQSQLNMSLTHLEVSPTNHYFPAVHRLLQVAANLYDADSSSSNPPGTLGGPSVFRPLFSRDGSTVFICGYTNDNNAASARGWPATAPAGIPMVIAAKKGLPNFNELVFQTAVQFTRKLEVGRPNTNSLPNQTNQILLLSISNLVGVEIWNSYSTPFTNHFEIFGTNVTSCILSNAVDGFSLRSANSSGSNSVVLALTNGNWHFTPRFPAKTGYGAGFSFPLFAGMNVLTNSRYYGGGFDNLINSYLPRTGELPVSTWHLMISNRLTYILSSPPGPNGKVLDFVSLTHQTNLDLTDFLMRQSDIPGEPYEIATMWNTNRISSPATLFTPTDGIMEQFAVSLGNPRLSDADWKAYNGSTEKTNSISGFRQFVLSAAPNSNLFMQAPFTAARKFVHTVSWQANDPLVHYLAEDLSGTTNQLRFVKPNDAFTNNLNLGRLNERYQPWLGNPLKSLTDAFDPSLAYLGTKDPGIFTPDDWNFPTNLMANPGLLGRVHRGTPWQTIYLKAEVANPVFWARQSQDRRTHPTNDWRIASLFLSLCRTTEPTNLFSINQTSELAWEGLLNGMTALSNTIPTIARSAPTNFDSWLIQSNSPPAQIIAAGINHARSVRAPQYFRQIGDILAASELTTGSPFINLKADPVLGFSAWDIQQFSFTDEVYEKIPEQLLLLLRADPILALGWKGGELHAQATVFANQWYALETSDDLQRWTTLATHFAETDTFEFPEALGTTAHDGFYRVRLIPQP